MIAPDRSDGNASCGRGSGPARGHRPGPVAVRCTRATSVRDRGSEERDRRERNRPSSVAQVERRAGRRRPGRVGGRPIACTVRTFATMLRGAQESLQKTPLFSLIRSVGGLRFGPEPSPLTLGFGVLFVAFVTTLIGFQLSRYPPRRGQGGPHSARWPPPRLSFRSYPQAQGASSCRFATKSRWHPLFVLLCNTNLRDKIAPVVPFRLFATVVAKRRSEVNGLVTEEFTD